MGIFSSEVFGNPDGTGIENAKMIAVRFIVKRDYQELSHEAARLVADAVKTRPQVSLCLPTGSTPRGMYAELVRIHRSMRLDFSRVRMLNLDEYVGLRSDHPSSFRSYLWREFFNHVNVRRANIYMPDDSYEETIRNIGGIDLLISGIGTNGHIAFNEPGADLDSRTRVVTLADSTIESMRSRFVPDELPTQAITIGLGTIMDARRIVLLASGSSKAEILARALDEPVTPDVPASVIQLHPDVTVIADEDAMSQCKSSLRTG
jgi:glucosamine-6-phosphate deaminase